jgi:hypothetical protein
MPHNKQRIRKHSHFHNGLTEVHDTLKHTKLFGCSIMACDNLDQIMRRVWGAQPPPTIRINHTNMSKDDAYHHVPKTR